MKKMLIVISTLLFSVGCFAEETPVVSKSDTAQTKVTTTSKPIEKGKQYIVLPTFPSPDKEVIEFFSFNCPSCFRFETEYHGSQVIANTLPKGVKLKRYHLTDFGPLAMDLAQAWAVANVLDIQDKALEAFYIAVQKDHKIKTADDIKVVFETLGVDAQTYDKTKDSFLVKAFMAQQVDAINEMQPSSIPTVVVNRKFYINAQELDKASDEAFVNDYARVAAFLINLDPNINPENKSNKK